MILGTSKQTQYNYYKLPLNKNNVKLEDISQVVLPREGKHTFVVVEAQGRTFFLSSKEQYPHAWVYVAEFLPRKATIPTSIFTPKGGGYVVRDDVQKEVYVYGYSENLGQYNPVEVMVLLEPVIKKELSGYVLIVDFDTGESR